MSKIKTSLYQYCSNYVDTRINLINDELQMALDSTADESKSTAGDKHETGRAMAQLEQEKLSGQLAEANKLKELLNSISPDKICTKPSLGSVVYTATVNYYIAISAGKHEINKEIFYLVSAASPIGKALLNAGANGEFMFNDVKHKVLKVL